MTDISLMQEAMAQASAALALEEVPVGCVVLHIPTDKIIGRGHNRRESDADPTAHAEILALRDAAAAMGSWRLSECAMAVTLEPCPMCAGAMIHSRLERLVWGAPDLRCGAHGSWVNLLEAGHPIHQLSAASGVMEEKSADLMRTFFKNRRMEKHDGEIIR